MFHAIKIIDRYPEHKTDQSWITVRLAIEILEIHAKAEGLIPSPVLNRSTLFCKEIQVPGQISLSS